MDIKTIKSTLFLSFFQFQLVFSSPDQLFELIKKGNISSAGKAIKDATNIDMKDHKGWTPLMWAAWKGYGEITKKILAKNPALNLKNNNGDSALHIACEKNHEKIVELLLCAGAPINQRNEAGFSSLMIAIQKAKASLVELLLNHGGDLDTKTAFGVSAITLAEKRNDPQINLLISRCCLERMVNE